ncbi:Splicing factor U2af large subunit B [Acorus gramineus]|uniref:Splicing factor U2af large subunit B n=1 Tax=Acorus gramineus TaxID=55184 RepID=A0AAV9ANW9_ACOGR|nr:Splicing factor U2af large subunit B [Acorus gramineus]
MAPPGATSILPTVAVPGQLPGVPQTMPGILPPNAFHFPSPQFGAIPIVPAQAMTQQATRHARRVYVGGLPPLANEQGVSVRVRRPTDYNPSLAAALGSSQPNPHLNLSAVGLTPGTLRGFDLVKDRDTGNSKGYGFCVYQDPQVTDIACAALNGLKMGDKTLTVRRATASSNMLKPEQDIILQQAQQHIAIQKMVLQASGAPLPGIGMMPSTNTEIPTKVLCLTEVTSADELMNDEDYQDILDDMTGECEKFGPLENVVIPRPNPSGEPTPGVGKVFLQYMDTASSARAKAALHGRKFDSNVVTAVYYPEDKFSDGLFE